MALNLLASNPNPTVSFTDPLPGLVNSYTGANPQKWVTGIPRYATANLAAVYPGIDAQYTAGANGVLTQNLLLAAGVDPTAVTFQIAQATSMTVDSGGSLLVKFGPPPIPSDLQPSLSYAAPLAFQDGAPGQVSRGASFTVLSTTRFGLTVQGLDTTQPLQISMQLNSVILAQPFVGFGNSRPASDAAGDSFFATQIADAAGKDAPFPAIGGDGCYNGGSIPAACSDVALYKYSAAGVLEFITYLAGRTRETAGFVGVAAGGAVVVAGTTDSADFPVTSAALQPAYAGPPAAPGDTGNAVSGDFFAARLDSSTGALLGATFLGGPNGDAMGAAALGADGSLYFLPPLANPSTGMPVTGGALQAACDGEPCLNGYVARLSPALDQLLYATYLPGIAQAPAQLYSDGSVYYAGRAAAGFPATPSAYQPQNAGGDNGIVARLDPTWRLMAARGWR